MIHRATDHVCSKSNWSCMFREQLIMYDSVSNWSCMVQSVIDQVWFRETLIMSCSSYVVQRAINQAYLESNWLQKILLFVSVCTLLNMHTQNRNWTADEVGLFGHKPISVSLHMLQITCSQKWLNWWSVAKREWIHISRTQAEQTSIIKYHHLNRLKDLMDTISHPPISNILPCLVEIKCLWAFMVSELKCFWQKVLKKSYINNLIWPLNSNPFTFLWHDLWKHILDYFSEVVNIAVNFICSFWYWFAWFFWLGFFSCELTV